MATLSLSKGFLPRYRRTWELTSQLSRNLGILILHWNEPGKRTHMSSDRFPFKPISKIRVLLGMASTLYKKKVFTLKKRSFQKQMPQTKGVFGVGRKHIFIKQMGRRSLGKSPRTGASAATRRSERGRRSGCLAAGNVWCALEFKSCLPQRFQIPL